MLILGKSRNVVLFEMGLSQLAIPWRISCCFPWSNSFLVKLYKTIPVSWAFFQVISQEGKLTVLEGPLCIFLMCQIILLLSDGNSSSATKQVRYVFPLKLTIRIRNVLYFEMLCLTRQFTSDWTLWSNTPCLTTNSAFFIDPGARYLLVEWRTWAVWRVLCHWVKQVIAVSVAKKSADVASHQDSTMCYHKTMQWLRYGWLGVRTWSKPRYWWPFVGPVLCIFFKVSCIN